MVSISPIVILLTALLAVEFVGSECAQCYSHEGQDVQRVLTPLQQTVQALRRIHTDCYDTGPANAKQLLATLKNELEDLVSDALADSGAAHLSASELQAHINAKLKADGVLTTYERADVVVDEKYVDPGYDYGDVFEVTVTQPAEHHDLLAVTTTIGVCCGEDTSVYLYRKHGYRWSLALAYTAGAYDEISGAHGRVQFGISPADSEGKFFIVIANVNPWCTSNWQSLRYAVLRESRLAHSPHVLLEKAHSIFLNGDPSYSLVVGRDSFSFVFLDEKFMELLNKGVDIDLNDRRAKRLLKYRVSGLNVVKVIDR
jgi:hypothetical protein